MRNSWFLVVLLVVLVVGCNGKQSGTQPMGSADSTLKPKVVFIENFFDFGNIKQGETVSHTFFFENEGTGNLIILDAIPSCGCTTPRFSKEPVAPGAQGQSYSFLIMMALVFVVMYFFMIRPQTKRQKELRKFQEALKKGDKIVTTGGIYGKITDVKDQTVTVEIAENIRIKVDKSAVLKDPSDLETSQK